MKRIDQLTHYDVPSGKFSSLNFCELSSIMFDGLSPTVADGQHALPIRGYYLTVALQRHRAGWLYGAHAIILHGTRVVAAFTVALTQNDAETLWKPFEKFYLRETDHGRPHREEWCCPKIPETAPWVASFPIDCRPIEAVTLPRLAGSWAMILSRVAVVEMNGCA